MVCLELERVLMMMMMYDDDDDDDDAYDDDECGMVNCSMGVGFV